MRFGILSGGAGWHVQDLARAAAELGHRTELLDFRRLSAGAGICGYDLAGYDCLIVRTMPPGSLEQVVFRMDLLHRAQARGMKILNPPRVLETCVDKYLTSSLLDAAGLRVPPTIVCQDADAAQTAFAALGGDVVVKPIFGSEGRGMVRVSDDEVAWRTFRTLERIGAILYLQKFIRHSGWDLRVFILNCEVLAAMERHCARRLADQRRPGRQGPRCSDRAGRNKARASCCRCGGCDGCRRRSAARPRGRMVRAGSQRRPRMARFGAGHRSRCSDGAHSPSRRRSAELMHAPADLGRVAQTFLSVQQKAHSSVPAQTGMSVPPVGVDVATALIRHLAAGVPN